ncbi:hypothetical protein J2855_003677 [Agrobacterium tumefaciens]|uniref:hypothetical protein n=1 Tax=Agrobacterium tumefaciens TaxID=358 RepID=UPI000DCFD3A6|nr:hypothetical protein [Agrobacterium tumefaciens]MBP2510029.1 hypothetical protein [Agrobacterium tumefaciens]MBP2519451.1 hypothetical protein [Agrobacterium tumefaciens]MBP2578222.1 hypothetical protein [Agrobacterium tumefaciens]MBP2596168.1 hypothetical protein [Agrobacterium tumefaciens]
MAKKKNENSLTFTDEENRPTYKLKNGEVVPMSDARIAAMQKNAWKEGESGNLAGRPPDPVETKMKMYQYTDEVIETLRDIYLNGQNEGARVKAAMAFITPFVAPAASKKEIDIDVNVTTRSVSKFLMSVTEDFETDPSLIDVTPKKPEDEDV